ncbi:MAG: hypothetical protein HYV59_07395 [Planctomycetes bacterium]|nr:hypothetical protein [Planctomycetota bacterium]
MIDTLKIYSRLKSKGIQEEAANEIAEIFNEIVSTEIATKTDIEKLKIELERNLAEIKVEILKWVAGMLVGQAALITALIKLL